MSNQLEIYTPAHKGLRSRLFTLSAQAGRLDYTNQAALDAFYEGLKSTEALIRFHDQWEEEGIHPLLTDRVPGGAEELEEEHRTIEHLLGNLVASVDGIRAKAADFEKRRSLGLECYLALNRFIRFFLGHIDDEEERIQPALWRLCTQEELITAVTHMPSSTTPQLVMANLEAIFPAVTIDELTMILTQINASASAAGFEGIMQLAERVLDAEDWKALKLRRGI
jgi:hypothetical protein